MAPAGCRVTDVNVDLALLHGDNSQVTARLTHDHAQGSLGSTLFANICALTANIVTGLDDDAGAYIGSVCPPLGGRYSTGGKLDLFDGSEAAGDWTLQIEDGAAGETGSLLNWSIEIRTQRP